MPAEAVYQTWLGNLTAELRPDFKDPTTAMGNWTDEIFAYFEKPITNAYTESAYNLAKGMNRTGRGYSFEVIRARMLYDGKARKDGAVTMQKSAAGDEKLMVGYMTDVTTTAPPRRMMRQVIEYGPYIPTLVKLLHDGYFE